MNDWRNHPSIFVSHSSADVRLGRAVRNVLEDLDHHVILLGLLQQMTEYEILAFLDKEIFARDWLLLLDSESARGSKWVQFEVSQAEKYGKQIYRISTRRYTAHETDRQSLEAAVQPCIASFSRSIRIFPTFSVQDRHHVEPILDYLVDRKYQVWDPSKDLAPGSNFAALLESEIREASVVLAFISVTSVGSRWVKHELAASQAFGRPIIPILLGSVSPPAELEIYRYIQVNIGELQDDSWRQSLDAILTKLREEMIEAHCE